MIFMSFGLHGLTARCVAGCRVYAAVWLTRYNATMNATLYNAVLNLQCGWLCT
jgi:hypothetical protein